MDVEFEYYELFAQFCEKVGNSTFKHSVNRLAPDIYFNWKENEYWAYKEKFGYTIFGKEVEKLNNTWNNFLEELNAKRNERETGRDDNRD